MDILWNCIVRKTIPLLEQWLLNHFLQETMLIFLTFQSCFKKTSSSSPDSVDFPTHKDKVKCVRNKKWEKWKLNFLGVTKWLNGLSHCRWVWFGVYIIITLRSLNTTLKKLTYKNDIIFPVHLLKLNKLLKKPESPAPLWLWVSKDCLALNRFFSCPTQLFLLYAGGGKI